MHLYGLRTRLIMVFLELIGFTGEIYGAVSVWITPVSKMEKTYVFVTTFHINTKMKISFTYIAKFGSKEDRNGKDGKGRE